MKPEYENESTIITFPNGNMLKTPAHPDLCEYVRLCDADGEELAYYIFTEWMEDETQAQEVMGAIMGLIKGEMDGIEFNPTKSTDHTRYADIISAARHILNRPNIDVVFEHGQWWAIDGDTGAQWSAVDAEGGDSYYGLDFEMVKEDG